MELAWIYEWTYKSKGVKRTLAAALSAAILASPAVPPLLPWVPLMTKLAGILGGVGVANMFVGPKAEK
jgi:hypothetical protein